jgi:putative Mn2+ efflux pump MntP
MTAMRRGFDGLRPQPLARWTETPSVCRNDGPVVHGFEWRLALVAVSLALDVFAVCVGVGMRGIDTRQKWRIGLSFAAAEMTMTIVGAGLGAVLGRLIGAVAGYIGFAALVGVGIYMIVEAVKESQPAMDLSRGWGLFVAALSLSLDSLGIGFSILYIGSPLVISLAAIGTASVISTSLGLALGRFLGARVEETAGIWAGVVLIATGLLFAVQKYFGGM